MWDVKERVFTVEDSDPWYIDPSDLPKLLSYVQEHVEQSMACTHGRGFTYDFCPIANGNLQLAIDRLEGK